MEENISISLTKYRSEVNGIVDTKIAIFTILSLVVISGLALGQYTYAQTSSQAASSEYGDINQVIINEGSGSSTSQSIDRDHEDSGKGLIVFVEFTNRGQYTDANVNIRGVREHIDLVTDSWVKYEFPKGWIPVGSDFTVAVTAYNEYDDTGYFTEVGHNGDEKEPERVYFDLRYD